VILSQKLQIVLVGEQQPQLFLNSAECVGEAVSKINLGIFFLKLITKTELVIPFLSILTFWGIIQSTWFITYEIAALLPCTIFFDTDPHPLMIQAVGFGEVEDGKVDVTGVILILDGKVEPLMMAARICVHAHVKLKVSRFGLNHHV